MNIQQTKLPELLILEPTCFQDVRGDFVKVFHRSTLSDAGLEHDFKESYYSTSKKDVIRGMHFQTPPEAHTKLVYVTRGKILDVVVDIRKNSPTYGEYITQEVSAENHLIMYIPIGFAHGFKSLEDGTSVTYLQTTMHSPENDAGIHIQSFGLDWGITDPIMSARDTSFPTLAEYQTPFLYS